MKTSLFTLISVLLIYAWLCGCWHEALYDPMKRLGFFVVILLIFTPYIMFILRTMVNPKPPWIIKIFESLLLLSSELSMLYVYCMRGSFDLVEVKLFKHEKLLQLMVVVLFLIIEYLIQVFMIKKSKLNSSD
jgi:hypothetical protein